MFNPIYDAIIVPIETLICCFRLDHHPLPGQVMIFQLMLIQYLNWGLGMCFFVQNMGKYIQCAPPPSGVSWFISPSNYSYKYHKP